MSDAVVCCGFALAHHERLGILRDLRAGRPVSGRLYAERNTDSRHNRASYHLRMLVDVGAVERTGADPFDRTSPGRRHRLYVFEGENSDRLGDLLDVTSGDLRLVDPEGAKSSRFRVEDSDLIAIGKAISHPVRVRIIGDLRAGCDWSPTTWARARRESLGDSSYHFKQLTRYGVAKETRTEPRRGAVEHFYGLAAARSQATSTVLDVLEGRVELRGADESHDQAPAGDRRPST